MLDIVNRKWIYRLMGWTFVYAIILSAVILPTTGYSKTLVVYSGINSQANLLLPYNILILNSKTQQPLEPFTVRGKIVLAHFSTYKILENSRYFLELNRQGLITKKRSQGIDVDEFLVNVNDRRWTQWVLYTFIPQFIRMGFQGIYFDTPKRADLYEDTLDTTINLIKTVHLHYPQLKIMIRDDSRLFDRLYEDIDMVIAESLFSSYDPVKEQYYLLKVVTRDRRIRQINNMFKKKADLKLYILDYWETDDQDGVAKLYSEHERHGFNSFITSINLDWIPPNKP
ncbi:MAG: endo alpha-1,4 polygalactosaminidase [Magnetococcales bacterium]|nr:endo alpha-1,4 polygalactosaminidase [Magnetococcales bacterium]